ncbi:FHA domain-containing protein [Lapillicoccus sp.]|uniref:FHA domain-containing protein n=1 Tax=Lapillicoccus sp. TaxID=1909287 RepID=UPI0025E29119|nr:FHA domain-containing protein [Lapillicoccus sp.]
MVSSPTVDVDIPPLGWTYIGGPSVHLLVALRDDDELLISASDAADSDDLDAVIDVLAKNGPRSAPSFAGVHVGDPIRVVAHGSAWIEVGTPEGQRLLAAPSARVWLDVDLEGSVEAIRLRSGPRPDPAGQPSTATTTLAGMPPASDSPAPADAASFPPGSSGPLVPVLPTGAGSAGPRGWLTDPAKAPDPSLAPARPEADAALPSPAEPPSTSSSIPLSTPSSTSSSTSHSTPPSGSPPGSSPPAAVGSFLDGLPSWRDHRPLLAGVPQTPFSGSPPPAASAPAPAVTEVPPVTVVTPAGASVVGEQTLTAIPSLDGPGSSPADPSPADPSSADPAPANPAPAHPLPGDAETDGPHPSALPLAGGHARGGPASVPPGPGPLPSVDPTDVWAASSDVVPAPAEVGYDHLFGRTVDRDAYLAKLVALGDRHDERNDERADPDEPVSLPPSVREQPPAVPLPPGTDLASGAAQPSADPAALPQVVSASDPVSPVAGGGLLISSVPWATPKDPAGLGAGTAAGANPPTAPSTIPEGPPVGGWPAPQVPGAPVVRPGPQQVTAPGRSADEPPRRVPPVGISTVPVAAAIVPVVAPQTPPPPVATPPATTGARFYSGRPAAAPAPVTHNPDSRDNPDGRDNPANRDESVTPTPADTGTPVGAVPPHDQGSGPSVTGVRCPSGHPNPPDTSRCRQCSREIAAQQPITMPRPPLGYLRLSSGDVVTLDRGVILGRAPKPPLDLPAASRPHVVRVASPRKDVSRTHLEVVLDGWQVVVRDLDATNGTTVTVPGGWPVRLRPQEQQVVTPGTRISLADEVELTFEVER